MQGCKTYDGFKNAINYRRYNVMKKLMSILLALALVITTNVTFAAAANNGPCDKPITGVDEEF